MDWITAPYRRRCRFHRAEDAPWVTIRWFPTTLPFLKGEQVINARIWDSDITDDLEVGEDVRDKPHPYRGGAVAGLSGGHVCGDPSWFSDGEPWPTDLPPTEYDADGIPTCCARGNIGFVGYAARPQALVAYSPPFNPSFFCETAPTPELGVTYDVTTPAVLLFDPPGNIKWIRFPNPITGNYVTVAGLPAGAFILIRGGGDCFTTVLPDFGAPNGTTLIIPPQPFASFLIFCTDVAALNVTFTFRCDPYP